MSFSNRTSSSSGAEHGTSDNNSFLLHRDYHIASGRSVVDLFLLLSLEKKLIFAIISVLFSGAVIQQMFTNSQYKSTMIIKLHDEKSPSGAVSFPLEGLPGTEGLLRDRPKKREEVIIFLQSKTIRDKIIDGVNADKRFPFLSKKEGLNIEFNLLPSSNYISISVIDINADRAKLIADKLLEVYADEMALHRKMFRKQSIKIIDEGLASGGERSKTILQQLDKYRGANAAKNTFIDSSGLDNSLLFVQSQSLENLIVKSEMEILAGQEKQNTLQKYLDAGDPQGAVFAGFVNSQISAYMANLNEIDKQIISLQKLFRDAHPQIIQLNTSKMNVQKLIYKSLEEMSVNFKNQNKTLLDNRDNLQKKMKFLQSREGEIGVLEQEYQVNEKFKLQLLQRRNNLEFNDSDDQDAFVVFEKPLVADEPFAPKRGKNIAVAFLFILIVSLLIVIASDALAPKILTSTELEKESKSPSLANIPKVKRVAENTLNDTLLFFKSINNVETEIFRNLRSTIDLKLNKKNTVILVTSVNSGEGKTTVAINLAAAFTEHNKKVLLVDGDLRSRAFYRIFKDLNGTSNGLAEVLQSKVKYNDAITKTLIGSLDIMMAGNSVKHPVELLEKQSLVDDFLLPVKNEYDYLIIDSTKVFGVIDPLIISKHVDGVILVASQGVSLKAMKKVSQLLRDANALILGTVFNKNIHYGEKYHEYFNKK